MRRTAVTAIVLAAIGALLLMAAGCGGGDDESAADTQAAAPATTESSATTEPAEPEASEESGELDFASSENCKELVELGAKTAAALSGTDPDAETTQNLLDAYAEEAPEEIRADFEVIADAYGKMAEALEDVQVSPGETPDAEATAKLQEIVSSLDTAELEQANTNITNWVNTNCKAG
jgi:hypothetical protein